MEKYTARKIMVPRIMVTMPNGLEFERYDLCNTLYNLAAGQELTLDHTLKDFLVLKGYVFVIENSDSQVKAFTEKLTEIKQLARYIENLPLSE